MNGFRVVWDDEAEVYPLVAGLRRSGTVYLDDIEQAMVTRDEMRARGLTARVERQTWVQVWP